jgi:hypothetical protein
MNTQCFRFTIKEYFKLSTGATAFVGLLEPSNYPIITTEDFVVEIRSDCGRSHIFNKISKDIFARKDKSLDNKFRSLQTFENMDEFIAEIKEHSVVICGYKK